MSEANVEEVGIVAGARCDGRRISETTWPRDCVIAILRRGQRVLIPHGDTVLRAGDVLVAVVEGDAGDDLRRLCTDPATAENRAAASPAL